MKNKRYLSLVNSLVINEHSLDDHENIDIHSILDNLNEHNVKDSLNVALESILSKNNCIHLNVSNDREINIYSFLNFVRYLNFLYPYCINRQADIETNNGLIKIRFYARYEKASLILIFNGDGTIDFTSLDKDAIVMGEKRLYVIKGNFSSSNLYSRSYKIKRLMALLNELDREYEFRESIIKSREILHFLKVRNSKSPSKKMELTERRKNIDLLKNTLTSVQEIYDLIER